MAKIRLKKKKQRYATVSRNLLSNQNISLQSKGLGSWLELHQDGFELNFEFILQNMKEGKHTLRKVLKELRTEDFLLTLQTRNERGEFETIWVFDSEGGVSEYDLPTTEIREAVTPEAETPKSVKRTQIRKKNIIKDKKENTHTETESDPLFEQWLKEYCSTAKKPLAYRSSMRKQFREGNEDAINAFLKWKKTHLEALQKIEHERIVKTYDYSKMIGGKINGQVVKQVINDPESSYIDIRLENDELMTNIAKTEAYAWIHKSKKETTS